MRSKISLSGAARLLLFSLFSPCTSRGIDARQWSEEIGALLRAGYLELHGSLGCARIELTAAGEARAATLGGEPVHEECSVEAPQKKKKIAMRLDQPLSSDEIAWLLDMPAETVREIERRALAKIAVEARRQGWAP